jgi:sulfoxide reductase heme-binding subunit YedZ
MIYASSPLGWYLIRSTGLVLLVLLTASVALGVLTTARWSTPAWPRFVSQGVHRNVSLVALVVLVFHIVLTVIDGFAPITWLDAVVPFSSAYRPLWLGLGAAASDLFLAVLVTSFLRARLGYRTWRGIHLLSWAMWPVAVLHGLGTGSDSRMPWAYGVYLACAAVVLASCWARLAMGWRATSRATQRARLAAVALSIVLPIAVVAWAIGGPLHAGWARKAGTPPSLLGGSATTGEGAGG